MHFISGTTKTSCVPDPVDLGLQDLGFGLILIHLTLALTSASILPALTSFSFVGDSEFLEDVAVHIDAPQLHRFHTHFFCRVNFNTPQLVCD
jgi:hypothetical protein